MKIILSIVISSVVLAACATTQPAEEAIPLDTPAVEEEGESIPSEDPLIMFPIDMPYDLDDFAEPEFVPAGGSLSLSMRMPLTLNPLLNEDITVARILRLIYEPLIGLDTELRPESRLLESFEIAPDGNSATLVLREGLTWDNGFPITASDILFSFNTLMNSSEYSVYRPNIEGVSSVSSAGHTITLNLSHTVNYAFLQRLNFPIIPSHHFSGAGSSLPSSPTNMTPIGNGPFRFINYRPAQEMVLSPNNLSLRPRPNIGRIRVVITPDDDTDVHAFNNGVIDVLRLESATQIMHNPSRQTTVTPYINGHFEFIGFNFNNDIMAQLPFRRAVAHALNIDSLVSSTYLNKAERAITPINPSAWFHDNNTIILPQNISLANTLLDEAGLGSLTPDGMRGTQAAGAVFDFSIRILVNNENKERLIVADALAEALRALRISAEVVRLDFEDYVFALNSGNFDIFIGGLNVPSYGDISFAFASGGEMNVFGYSNTIMDAFLEIVSTATTELEFHSSMSELQHFFAYDIPVIGLVYRKAALLTSGDIIGELSPSINNIYKNIQEWFIS